MDAFDYFEPKTVAEACELLSQNEEAKLLAGGVSLGALLKNKLIFPGALINLKSVGGLRQIQSNEDGDLEVGALCRQAEILSSELIQERFPLLSMAAGKIASPPIRNMGTIGGNVCHAEPAADLPPALIALGAEAEVVGLGGARREAVHALFADYYELSLSPEEVVTAFHLPTRDGHVGSAFLEITKNHNSIAVVNVAAMVELDASGVCTYAGLGVGGVAATPLRIVEAGELVGTRIGDNDIGRIAQEAMAKADPISNAHASAAYRRKMVGVLVERALRTASAKAEENRGQG